MLSCFKNDVFFLVIIAIKADICSEIGGDYQKRDRKGIINTLFFFLFFFPFLFFFSLFSFHLFCFVPFSLFPFSFHIFKSLSVVTIPFISFFPCFPLVSWSVSVFMVIIKFLYTPPKKKTFFSYTFFSI